MPHLVVLLLMLAEIMSANMVYFLIFLLQYRLNPSEELQSFDSERWMLVYDNQLSSKDMSELSLAQNVIAAAPDVLLLRQTKDLKT